MSDLGDGDGEYYACFVCKKPVDFDAPETVKARRIIHTEPLSGDTEEVEGVGLVFHRDCYMENPGVWRRVT